MTTKSLRAAAADAVRLLEKVTRAGSEQDYLQALATGSMYAEHVDVELEGMSGRVRVIATLQVYIPTEGIT